MSLILKLFGAGSWHDNRRAKDDFRGGRLTPSTISPNERLSFGKDITLTLSDFVRLSVRRIDGLAAEHHTTVTQIILDGSKKRSPRRDVAKRLQQHYSVDRQTAIAIVSLQLNRVSAVLARERSLEAGLTRFKWRWSGALDENPDHQAREGLVLSWLNPTLNGKELDVFDLPGMAPDCRCVAKSGLDFD